MDANMADARQFASFAMDALTGTENTTVLSADRKSVRTQQSSLVETFQTKPVRQKRKQEHVEIKHGMTVWFRCSSISPRSFRDLPKSRRKRQSPTRPDDSWREIWGKLADSCGDYSPEEAWGKLQPTNRHKFLTRPRKVAREPARNFRRQSTNCGGGDYSWEKTWGSSRRVVAASPGDVAGDAPRPCPDLRREIFPGS